VEKVKGAKGKRIKDKGERQKAKGERRKVGSGEVWDDVMLRCNVADGFAI
jgi:hypothetical protein